MSDTTAGTPMMMIHGAWLTSGSWDTFADYFRSRGFDVSAPEWPRKQGGVQELRQTTEDIKGLGLDEIVDAYEEKIRALDEPPVLVGHSFGGLIVELLLSRGLGRAAVAMSPAPPKGIIVLPIASLRAASPALAHPTRWHGVVPLTLEEFTRGFVNTWTPDAAADAYEQYYVPETGQIFYEAGFANFHIHSPADVHFDRDDRAPLLIIGADKDQTVPAAASHKAYEKYGTSSAQTDYLEFAGRPHLMMVGDGWQEIAGAIEQWLDSVLAVSGARTVDAPA
jgi:alpha-beta hydrolase superfamily lysophospholipase